MPHQLELPLTPRMDITQEPALRTNGETKTMKVAKAERRISNNTEPTKIALYGRVVEQMDSRISEKDRLLQETRNAFDKAEEMRQSANIVFRSAQEYFLAVCDLHDLNPDHYIYSTLDKALVRKTDGEIKKEEEARKAGIDQTN